MNFIVGLGNPGAKYKNTRHNIGFTVVEVLAEKLGLNWKLNKKFNAEIAADENLTLIKPQTFMNNSGRAVRATLNYYKILPKTLGILAARNADLSKKLIVIHDDLDLILGKYKIQAGHSSAGHRGVQSIIDALKTQNFTRVRVGIGNELLRVKIPAEKFVLEKFTPQEKEELKRITPKIIENIL
ncbi:MAG: aminoacyl-tRNA hydrolase [Patescibacteria group bacterium]